VKILLYDLGTVRSEINEPLGIETLAIFLEKHDPKIKVDLKWFHVENRISTKQELESYDIIGFSLNIGTYERFIEACSLIEQLDYNPTVVVGNVLGTFAYEAILRRFPQFICVRGEGEQALLEIVVSKETGLLTSQKLTHIPNLAFYSDGNIVTTPRRSQNLDELFLPRRDFATFVKNNCGIMRIEASRGCSWSKCKFCSVKEKYGDGNWRAFPIEHVLCDLVSLGKLGAISLYFTDEDFFGNDYKRAGVLAEKIIEYKQNGLIPDSMNFFISATANNIEDKDGYVVLKQLKLAGLREVFLGIESGCVTQLARYGKKATVKTNSSALSALQTLGLEIDVGYILFDPIMTFDELVESFKYAEQIGLNNHDSSTIKSLRIQPFTSAVNVYEKEIIGKLDIDSLSYPYNFEDEKVSQVFNLFSKWESEQSKLIYQIQSNARGEVNSENDRHFGKGLLIRFRQLDYKVLQIIIDLVSGRLTRVDFENEYRKNELKRTERLLAEINNSIK
jgi:radical SAM superfamily enzyme YgiQ (UPF0313 family)